VAARSSPAEPDVTWGSLVAAADPAAMAVVTGHESLSRAELLGLAAGGADWLDRHGVAEGTAVPALLAPVGAAFALAVGAAATGRSLAPLNPRATLRELVACAAPLARRRLIVAAAQFAGIARELADAVGARLAVLDGLTPAPRLLDLCRRPDEVVVVIHTSGTTGRPKPVPLRQGRLAARVRSFAQVVGFGPGSVFASGSPFHHVAGVGMFLTALGAGATLVCVPSFTVDGWAALEPLGVTHALLVPTMIEMLLEARRLRPGSLRSLQYGAAPIRPETVRRMRRELPGVRLTQFFGQTEGSPITALDHEAHLAAVGHDAGRLRSVGRPVNGVELSIADPDERGIGEILARGSHFFVTDHDGWLHTGDEGRVDEDGFLYLMGRKGDMIIRGGLNVYPAEVEEVLAAHPLIREAAVVGVRHDRLGEVAKAYVVAADQAAPPDAGELRRFARGQLSGYKVPDEWVFVSELPRSPAGKVLRRQLRA
jgi:acyl-CoA synthetase (AMP-forming)/AMP-acid ligase II